MFYIVESDQQLEILKSYSEKGGYIKVISSNDNYHPLLTKTIAVYLRPLDHEEGYIIPINHDEGLNVDKDRVYDILKQYKILYTIDKKELLYHFILKDVIDLSLVYSMTNYERLELGKNNLTYNWFYNRLHDFKEVNALIPITKLYEKCEEDYKVIEFILHIAIPNGFDFYNKTATSVFFAIEHTGLRTIYQPYLELFKPNNPVFNMEDNIAYTSYNLYNTTSRPTNAFNSVNYAAIPKAPEFRKAIIPQNDLFVAYDYDGYHLRILCEQVGYELTDESAHIQLARLYFKKEVITQEEYANAKQINFQAIYGKIPPEYAFLEVFEKMEKYTTQLWKQFKEQGYIQDPISGKRFTRDLSDMHPQKLLNYLMQSLETSRNIRVLEQLIKYLRGKKTKIALYVYDAIIFDFNKEDRKETLEEIQRIMESEGRYPTKIEYGKSLDF